MSIAYEDTPFADWLKKNRWTLIGGILLIVVVQAYVNFGPKLREKGLRESWQLYNVLLTETSQEGLAGVGGQLARARQDDRIHPWYVYYVSNVAMQTDDREALEAIRSELAQLNPEITMSTDSGIRPVAEYLGEQIDIRLSGAASEATNPAATEELVEIVVSSSSEDTYTLIATLYRDAAPTTVDAFLAAVDAGAFEPGSVTAIGQSHLVVPGFGNPDADPPVTLPLERAFGYTHVEGALCTMLAPATLDEAPPRAQLQESFQIQLGTNHSLDGRRTVFGQVTEGLEALKEGLGAPDVALELVSIQRVQA